jgi:hypothetical protein
MDVDNVFVGISAEGTNGARGRDIGSPLNGMI